ncbi:MAG: hypothetical protein WBA12_03600 [Catalinimonas sp.]
MKRYFYLSLLLMALMTAAPTAQAQCAMCRATVETNVNNGDDRVGSSLNIGILYLMGIPYVCLGVIGYFWYRKSRQRRQLAWSRAAARGEMG